MSELPLVTVIALCYNHARFAVECLESIRNQTYPYVQIIVMDDCSSDDSVKVIRDWIDRYEVECRFIVHQKNLGVCRTINEALGMAQGKYISMIATDDSWLPDKISRQVAIMEPLSDNVGILYSDAYQMDAQGLRLPKMFIEAHTADIPLNTMPEGDIRERLILGNFIPAMTTLIRRSVYDRVGRYDDRLAFEDWDFWLRAACHFRFTYSSYPSASYRILGTSLARTLTQKGNIDLPYTYYLIDQKILAMPGLSQKTRALSIQRLTSNAMSMHTMDHPHSAAALAKALTATGQLLAMPGLSQKTRALSIQCLTSIAMSMYAMDHPRSAAALVKAFTLTWQRMYLFRALAGYLGIRNKQYLRIVKYLRSQRLRR